MVKNTEINPQAKEAWKVTKSSVKGEGAHTHTYTHTGTHTHTHMHTGTHTHAYSHTHTLTHTHTGAATMFVDMERAAVAVVKSMGKETSKTVGHKYGEDAGQVTDNSLSAASNTAVLAHVRKL